MSEKTVCPVCDNKGKIEIPSKSMFRDFKYCSCERGIEEYEWDGDTLCDSLRGN